MKIIVPTGMILNIKNFPSICAADICINSIRVRGPMRQKNSIHIINFQNLKGSGRKRKISKDLVSIYYAGLIAYVPWMYIAMGIDDKTV